MRIARAAAPALWPALLLALLGGCAGVPRGGYYQDDGPPDVPPADLLLIPEPVPREEPLSAYGNKPYHIAGHGYTPLAESSGYRERGVASWYGKKFHGRRTSSGEPYDMYRLTAAHRTLPLPSYARVRNLTNGKTLIVRVNDRGPFHDNRLMDLSYAAAVRLGVLGNGTALVEVEGLSARDPAPAPVVAAGGEVPRLYLQIGAFASRQNAESLRTRLERDDLRPVEIHAARNDRGALYRVRIGPLASVEDSDRLAARVSASGLGEARVVVE